MASFEHIAQRLVSVSVPSIGSLKPQTLDAALARVARAERELQDARAEARRLGRAAGKKLSALFEDSIFVKRSSAEAWCDEARAEAHLDGANWLADKLERAHRPESEKRKDPFYQLAARMVHKGQLGLDLTDKPVSEIDAIQARILKSREVDLSSNAAINAPTEHGKLAEAILAAGKRARSPTDSDPPGATNALSQEILRQGRRRRGLEP
jgi:vacuolar-type H+-ATPase subunit H